MESSQTNQGINPCSHAGFIPFFLLGRTEMLSISESQTMDVKVQKVGKQLRELWRQCLYCTDNKNGEAESNQLLHFSNSDLAGTLTQDLRNRNPTLYTTKLRGLFERKTERGKPQTSILILPIQAKVSTVETSNEYSTLVIREKNVVGDWDWV